MNRYDVAIVGAGPAGMSAAIELTRRDRRVVVIDKATFPRDKCCGDGLTTAALRNLEHIGFDPRKLASWTTVDDTTWRSPSGHTIELNVPHDGGVRVGVAKRRELDAALVEHGHDLGVEVREATALQAATTRHDGATLVTDAGNIECSFVIGADGTYSPLRRLLGLVNETYLGEIHAFRQYFTNVTGPAAKQLFVSFEPDILPGYFWSFPLANGEANVGFGVERRTGQSVAWMKDAWADIVGRRHIREALGADAKPAEAHRAWPIPARIRGELLADQSGRVLFVGDAARVVDPLTGEGIAQALETGRLAAEAIVQSPDPAATYRYSIRRGLQFDNRFAAGLARIVRHDAGARLAIRMAPLGPWRGRYAVRWVFEDNPRAGLLSPWRWKQRFVSKPTAFATTSSGSSE